MVRTRIETFELNESDREGREGLWRGCVAIQWHSTPLTLNPLASKGNANRGPTIHRTPGRPTCRRAVLGGFSSYIQDEYSRIEQATLDRFEVMEFLSNTKG